MGNERLTGGAGDDKVMAGDGNDRARGSDGDDVIDPRNGVEDSIDCGAGDDTVIVYSREDGVLNCETVQSP
ncbi:MAG TPA: hypothetical protein VH231_16535 [Solirubrobacteraceae bacterium]|nr:hypothetical protein [Solirubrobacteraceae bacterium]